MFGKIMMLLNPVGAFIATPVFIPVLHAKESVACHECHMKRLPKANELPLYDTSHEKDEFMIVEEPRSSIEEAVSLVRKNTEKYIVALDEGRKQAIEICDTGIAHSKSTYEYITEDSNVIPRSIAIASGGLVGFLLSLRGGIFKKALNSTAGIVVVASACYPQQAKQYAQTGYVKMKENAGNLLKQYGGYDVDKMTISAQEKFSRMKSVVKLDDLVASVKTFVYEPKSVDKIAEQVANKTHGDSGQSNSKDSDMYTTRK